MLWGLHKIFPYWFVRALSIPSSFQRALKASQVEVRGSALQSCIGFRLRPAWGSRGAGLAIRFLAFGIWNWHSSAVG